MNSNYSRGAERKTFIRTRAVERHHTGDNNDVARKPLSIYKYNTSALNVIGQKCGGSTANVMNNVSQIHSQEIAHGVTHRSDQFHRCISHVQRDNLQVTEGIQTLTKLCTCKQFTHCEKILFGPRLLTWVSILMVT